MDISWFNVETANKQRKERLPAASLKFLQMDTSSYIQDKLESYDLAACLGASSIFRGFKNTLKVLSNLVRKGGLLVIGEP